jgi:hypothetical protein
MTKKRTSLDAIMTKAIDEVPLTPPTHVPAGRPPHSSVVIRAKKPSVYLTAPVYEQLRRLAFEERGKMHDYILEGLDLVFRQKGLPSIAELNAQADA